MIRRAFIKRFTAGVLGCGMLAEALLSRGPSMQVVETESQARVTTTYRGDDYMDLGPRVRDRDDMSHSFEPPYSDKPWATLHSPHRYVRSIRLGVLHVRNSSRV